MELADTLDLGSSAARRGGSTPFTRIIILYCQINFCTCGSSSVVEHHLAKVGVASSNLVFRSIIRRHSQVVRHRSATPLPPVQIRLPPPFFFTKNLPLLCRCGGIGRRARLKIVFLTKCRFDPDHRYLSFMSFQLI